MNPTPNEMARGIRELLRADIAPELTSARAVTSLRKIMAALRDIDWNESGFRMARDNRALHGLAADILAWIEARPERARGFAQAAAALRRVADGGGAESFARVHEANLGYRDAIGLFIDATGAAENAASAAEAEPLRRQIATVLGQTLR